MLTELGRSQVEVQRCPLHAEVGEELARRKWTVEVDAKAVEAQLQEKEELAKEVEDEEEQEAEEENNCDKI